MGEIDNPAFYERHWEHVSTAKNAEVLARAERLVAMIPEGVRTIVDVGCGDGTVTARLAREFDVTGVDRSTTALERVGVPSVEASADALPFPDASFDLAVSSEVLEHLPDGVLERAARELDRVSRGWVCVTVPYRENLARRRALCPRCAQVFHVDGHLRAFDEDALDALFPGFTRVATARAGPPEAPTFAAIEKARQRLCRRWFVWSGSRITCPRCGETDFRRLSQTVLHRRAERALDAATRLLNARLGRAPEPYWILALYRRAS